jgi:hypothetical protein
MNIKVLDQHHGDGYSLYHGDSVVVLQGIPDNSVGLGIHSPPYIDLYCYTPSPRDIGNSTPGQFWEHYQLIIDEHFRVLMPGRVVAVDCTNVPAMKERDGYIGLKDFRGDLIRRYEKAGFIYHSEHCIYKDPLLEATRSKALGLMHQQLLKDSSRLRAGLPSYLLAFRKPGKNPEVIAHPNGQDHWCGLEPPEHGNISHERWRRYARPVWMDIDFTRTLNARRVAKGDDQKHVCPMPLDIIERALWLWSNPGDVVLDPFGGIGSTAYACREMDPPRRAITCELHAGYFKQSIANVASASKQLSLLG